MLKENIEAMSNLALKRRLLRISPIESKVGVSYCITPSNDYVLLKNDVPLDDLTNPREAIRKMISDNIKNEMKKDDIIINFGIGLGYLLDETFNTFPSRIFIYEPDLNLLHFVLSNVNISEHLASGRVYITNNLDELIAHLTSVYLSKDRVEILYLQNYVIVKNKEMLMLAQKVFDACKSRMVDISTITKFSKRWMLNTIENFASIRDKEAYLLSDLEGKFIGQTALIAAAGPSLNDSIEDIQKNRDKFVIFAVNKTVKYLLQNGITPDFIVALDAANMQATLGGFESHFARTNCIMEMRTDRTIMNRGFNKVFVNFSESDFFIKKVARYNNFIKFYETGGSASTMSLVAAIKMGFSKIVFAGLDLAFKDNIIYSDGETMQRISQEKMVVNNIQKDIVKVPSINGSMVYSRDDYKVFIRQFEMLINELEYNEIYSLSTFAAKIEGIKPIKFEELNLITSSNLTQLNFVEPFKFNLKEFLEEEFFNINNIISSLSNGGFSTVLVNAVVKSMFIYQYLQAEVLNVLQKNMSEEVAENFVACVKSAIKEIVGLLQKKKLI